MDAKYINKNYLEETIKDYDNTIVGPIRSVVSNIYYNTAEDFNRYNDLLNVINASISGGIGLGLQLNYINSTSPVNYQDAKNIIFTAGQIGNIWCATPGKAGTQYYDWNTSTNTLTFSSLTGIITANANMANMFSSCIQTNFIGNIIVPNNATSMSGTFFECHNLNQNILIPNSVTNMHGTFTYCINLNQNILIPNSVTSIVSTFSGCSNLNQNILIPNSVSNMYETFSGCSNLNQNILIPNSVTSMSGTFIYCNNLNQNILIPNSVTIISETFTHCINLNQNILIPNSVSNMYETFFGCYNLNQNILIPNSVTSMSGTFAYCTNLNQNILIPNTVSTLDKEPTVIVGGWGLFDNCKRLNKPIAIPNSVISMYGIFAGCTRLNQDDMYIYSQNITNMENAYKDVQRIGNIHIPTSVPKDTSNFMYNCLVNGNTGYTFAPENIINDLPVDIAQWPPV